MTHEIQRGSPCSLNSWCYCYISEKEAIGLWSKYIQWKRGSWDSLFPQLSLVLDKWLLEKLWVTLILWGLPRGGTTGNYSPGLYPLWKLHRGQGWFVWSVKCIHLNDQLLNFWRTYVKNCAQCTFLKANACSS